MEGDMREVQEYLIQLGEKNGGKLTPEMVVAEAADKESPLHDYFEWDQEKAAYSFRIEQARTLIRSVRVVVTVENKKIATPYYVRDPGVGSQEQGYVSIPQLRTDAELAREAMVAEFARAGSALDRAKRVAAALNMEEEVERVTREVRQLAEHVSAVAS